MPGRKVVDIDYERALREGEEQALGEYDRPHSFSIQTEDGLQMHINGDPRLSDDALAAIVEVGRLAMKMYEEGRLPHQRAQQER